MNTIVFVLRGCPVGWLGAYGNEWVATPNLDRVAAESVVFDRHVSDRPDPDAARAAWLGGAPALPVLSSLRAAGVKTVLVRANHSDTDGPDWYYAAWGEVFDARPMEDDLSPLGTLTRELPGLLERLVSSGPFLLWIETDRLLPPWDVRQDVFEAYFDDEEVSAGVNPDDDDVEEIEEEASIDATESAATRDEQVESAATPPDRSDSEVVTPWFDPPTGPIDANDPDALEWLHSTFAAVVTSLDAELGVLFGQFKSQGLDRSAAWLVTSDLGYPLGEHGQIGLHRPWLHEELVHVPLMVRLPAAEEALRRVAAFTQPPDIASTILDLFGLKPADSPSLLDLARGSAALSRGHAVTRLEVNGAAEGAFRTEEWTYLLPLRVPEGEERQPQLYANPDDRWEVNDLRSRNVSRADELEAELNASE